MNDKKNPVKFPIVFSVPKGGKKSNTHLYKKILFKKPVRRYYIMTLSHWTLKHKTCSTILGTKWERGIKSNWFLSVAIKKRKTVKQFCCQESAIKRQRDPNILLSQFSDVIQFFFFLVWPRLAGGLSRLKMNLPVENTACPPREKERQVSLGRATR